MTHGTHAESNGELDALGALWRDESRVPGDARARLRARVKRDTLRLRLSAAGQLVALGAFAWLTREVLATWPRPVGMAWSIGVWLVAALAVVFSVRNWRGLRRPLDESIPAYLALAEGRARARVCAARAVQALVALELVVVVPAVLVVRVTTATTAGAPGRALVTYALSGLLGAVYVAGSIWYARRARRELEELTALRAVLAE